MNELISIFVNQRPTALLLDIRDEGTDRLEHSRPAHVDIYYHFEDIPAGRYELIIAVTPCLYECETPILYYHPAVLHLGRPALLQPTARLFRLQDVSPRRVAFIAVIG